MKNSTGDVSCLTRTAVAWSNAPPLAFGLRRNFFTDNGIAALKMTSPLERPHPDPAFDEEFSERRPGPDKRTARPWTSDQALDTVFFVSLVGGLAWAPFYLGSNRPLPWGVNGLLFTALAVAYELALVLRGRPHPYAARRVAVPILLFCGVLLGVYLQTWIFPTNWMHPIWSMTADALGRPVSASISVNRSATLFAFARLLTCASAFWLSLQLSRRARGAGLLLASIGVIVTCYAAYGVVLAALFDSAIPPFDVAPATGSVRSTFVGRNNFATYAGIGLVVLVAMILELYGSARERGESLRAGLRRFLEITGRRGALLLLMAFVTFGALLGSGSRGGVGSTVIGLVCLFVLLAIRGRRFGAAPVAALVLVSAALVTAYAAFGDLVAGRIAAGVGDTDRSSVYRLVISAILDRPWAGFGFGTFADVFPMYRDQSTDPVVIWDKAHNTYLETVQDLGVPMGLALIGSVTLLVARCFRGALERGREATAPLAAAAAGVLVGVHALVDFSLQIEAVSLTFMALLGAGVAQSESSRLSTAD